MKTILFADWHMQAMCDLVVQSAQKANREYRFENAGSIETAIASLSGITPDLVISQPSLLMQEDFQLLRAASMLRPVPKLLVWWGNKTAFEAFKEQCNYPLAVSNVGLPCDVHEIMQQIDKLLV